MTDETKLTC